MSISFEDYQRLRNVGFTEYEIEQLSNATDPSGNPQPPIDLNSAPWEATLESRKWWLVDKIEKGWSEEEINETINNFYMRDRRRSPWDFLKIEYRPPKRVDYWSAMRNRKKAEIVSELGEY